MSAVCDSCGSALNADGAFCRACGRARTFVPAWAARPRPAVIPAGAEITHESRYPVGSPAGPGRRDAGITCDRGETVPLRQARPVPAAPESRMSTTWRVMPPAPGGMAGATALADQAPGKTWTGTAGSARAATRLGRIGELGPAWLSALAAVLVALTGAGFFAGRVSAPSNPAVQPTKIITRTVPVTASPAASPGVSTTPTPTSGVAVTSENGALLGSYTFTLPQYGSAPLGTSAPTQAQILGGTGQDVIWNTGAGGSPLQTGGGDQMLSLPSGSTPTYQACKTDTLTSGEESYNAGTAYCIIEATGKMAGVTVVSADVSQSPWYLVLHVVIWENSP